MIRAATSADTDRLAQIYNHYVTNTIISFEEVALSHMEMAARLQSIESLGLPWLVIEEEGLIQGFAYASNWKVRHAYRYSVEISAYLAPEAQSKGYGTQLYRALFQALKSGKAPHRPHAVIACIALPNDKSIALHKKFGMREVGYFKEVGYKFDRWVDVAYWQVNLDSIDCEG
ncbi:MAG: GNAT family N-acetyltransferase [Pseudohongiellaceae bacterium]|nr:GNAT family N-acetyltransferase [Pseudohongiellaceae bacterium]